jgi:glycerol-3-phosphate acyltransferase PlsY
MRIRIRDLESFRPWIRGPGSGMENQIRIRDKHAGSATLLFDLYLEITTLTFYSAGLGNNRRNPVDFLLSNSCSSFRQD